MSDPPNEPRLLTKLRRILELLRAVKDAARDLHRSPQRWAALAHLGHATQAAIAAAVELIAARVTK